MLHFFEMSKSQRLRIGDVRRVYQVVGECRELGGDSRAWRTHLFESLCEMVGAQVGIGGEIYDFWSPHFQALGNVDLGWCGNRERQGYLGYMRDIGPTHDELYRRFIRQMPAAVMTRSRRQLIDDRTWYRSACFNQYVRVSRIDARLISFQTMASCPDSYHCITLHRAVNERPFNLRQRRLLHWLHHEIGPLIGRQLATARAPSASSLSPRLRQVLRCLLEGDSEKQVASRLGLRRSTTHQYVKAVYRNFGVCSRGELAAWWLLRNRPLPPMPE